MVSAREMPLGRVYTRMGLSQQQAGQRWGGYSQAAISKYARQGVTGSLLKAILADSRALEAMTELGISVSDLLVGISTGDEAA